ncbi:MAG TPA: hypothetical protein VH740_26760 [Vicinamibacterales bacterium]
MSRRAYVTYFDQRYLALAIVMLRSLRRWDPEASIFPLCFDGPSFAAAAAIPDPKIVPVSHAEILAFEPRLAACATRTRGAFYATHKPVLPLLVLARRPELTSVMHVDADCCFHSPPASLFDEIGDASIALSAHDFSPAFEALIRCGPFNAGLIYWRNDATGRRALADYREDCLDWCEPHVDADGRFMNQGYLTRWPARYSGVHVIRHPGVNLAYWNIARRTLRASRPLTVDGQPLVCYHFSGLFLDPIGIWRTARREFGDNLRIATRAIYRPYLKTVARTDRRLRRRDSTLAALDTGWEKEGAPVGRGPWPRTLSGKIARAAWLIVPGARVEPQHPCRVPL